MIGAMLLYDIGFNGFLSHWPLRSAQALAADIHERWNSYALYSINVSEPAVPGFTAKMVHRAMRRMQLACLPDVVMTSPDCHMVKAVIVGSALGC
ncbi:MAG: hypothetical protein ABW128_06120 [Rhizorhabdus sp.]